MRKCDSCGKPYQETKDVFCPHCGAVAQKQCTHGSSFDSNRYDRGEIYKNNKNQYQNTTYNKGLEPHAQRTPYNPQNNEDCGNKIPQINLPDFKKVLSKVQGQKGKPIMGIIIFVVVIAFNAITAFVNDDVNGTDYWEDESLSYVEEYANEIYGVVDKATIEIVEADGESKTFMLKIRSMGFEDLSPEYVHENIYSGVLAKEILSENTFVEMRICDFSKGIVSEENYNNAIDESYNYSGKQIDGKCKYEFSYRVDYDEIIHIVNGVDFYLGDGSHINAEMPFSAFSVSENGEITYYTSYSDYDSSWNTVFSECSNEQEINRDVCIGFESVELNEEK